MEVCIISFLYDWVGENCFWPSLYQPRSHSIFPPYHLLSWLLETSQFFSTHQCEVVGIDRRAGSPTVPTFPLSTNPALGEKVHGFTAPSSERSWPFSPFVFVLWLAWFMSKFLITSQNPARVAFPSWSLSCFSWHMSHFSPMRLHY